MRVKMALTLDGLPTELLYLTLQQLPISDLLSFATTSKSNYAHSIQCLTTLDLAIFPRRIHSLLAFFDALNDDDDEAEDESEEDPPVSKYWSKQSMNDKFRHQVGLITPSNKRPTLSRSNTPPSPQTTSRQQRTTRHQPTANSGSTSRSSSSSTSSTRPTPLAFRTAEIASQNTMASQILSTPSLSNLHTLTLRLYDLSDPSLASALATHFSTLTTLNLEFCHPYIHDTSLPAKYWRDTVPPGSPIWNILAGVGDDYAKSLRLRSLRSLRITRSGITSFQLRNWVEMNPHLRELRLGNCRGVDRHFVDWLAEYVSSSNKGSRTEDGSGRAKLEVVRLTDCALLELKRPGHDDDGSDDNDSGDFAWIDQLARSGVLELSLRGCKGVDEDVFLHLATTRWVGMGIRRIVSPKGVVVRPLSSSKTQDNATVDGDALVFRSRGSCGSVSPALTVSDGMIGNVSGLSCLGKIEVDPAMAA